MYSRGLVAFLGFLLFVAICVFVFTAHFRGVFTAKTIKGVLRGSNAYSRVTEIIKSTNQGDDATGSSLTNFIFKEGIDQNELQNQIEKVIDGIMSYVRTGRASTKITFDLRPFKSKMHLQNASEMAEQFEESMKTLPICQPGQQNTPDSMPTCISQKDAEGLKNAKQLITTIPDEYNLDKELEKGKVLKSMRTSYLIVEYLFWISLVIGIMMIGLIMLITRKALRSGFKTIAWIMMIPTLICLIVSYFNKAFLADLVGKYIVKTTDATAVIGGISGGLLSDLFRISLIYCGSIFVIGLILYIISFILPKTDQVKKNVQPAKATS